MHSERQRLAPPFAYRRRVFTGGLAAGIWCALGAASAADLPQPCGAGCGPGVWIASDPARAPSVAGNAMTIEQISDREIFNWQSFNVGKDASVTFRQPSSSAIALNRIHDGDPSRILGTVTANGQIYLLNPNGIVFGAGSQVDAHSLVASTLDVSDDIFNGAGIVNAINQSIEGGAAFEAVDNTGAIVTEPGALLRAASGGRILIIAPEIEHGGRIETPEGQTILAAASDRVYLAAADDPSLRGLLVEVDSGGSIENLGEIVAERGNVSLVGLAINQAGRIRATTSVNLNGSVRLLARDGAQVVTEEANVPVAQHAGTLILAAGSVTEVLPELDSAATAPDAQPQLQSNIELVGREIRLAGGSMLAAPGGNIALTATAAPDSPLIPNRAPNDSSILVEAGAVIDVAGTATTVLPITRNVVEVELRANELRDAPLQRDGALRGKKIAVDVREGTPLADVSGAIAAIKRDVGERLANGGRVSILSEGSFVLAAGATIDFAGGTVTYEGGIVETTRLLAEGEVIDIAAALPDQVYDGIFAPVTVAHQKWGVRETFAPFGAVSFGHYEAGYVEGRDAGAFELIASAIVLDGNLDGTVTIGPYQREPAGTTTAVRTHDEIPFAGMLTIGYAGQTGADTPDFRTPDVTFATERTPVFDTAVSPLAINLTVTLSTSALAASGIGRLLIYSNGRIELPEEVALALPAGGELVLTAGELDIAGDIAIPSGEVALEARPTLTTAFDAARLEVAASSRIETRGSWVNETPILNPFGTSAPRFIDGGAIMLRAAGELALARGSLLDVGGGALLDADGELHGGAGGAIAIELDYLDALPLDLGATLRGDAISSGGSLSVQGSGFRIRDAAPIPVGKLDGIHTVVTPDWLRSGGFSEIELTATHTGIAVAPGTVLDLVASNLALDSTFSLRRTGDDITTFSRVVELPALNRTPVTLALHATSGEGEGQLPMGVVVDDGAIIRTDPGGAITVSSDSTLLVNGTLAAPGGNIALTVTSSPGIDFGYQPDQALWIGARARLLAPAAFVSIPNDSGFRRAVAFAGGTIAVQALRGYVIADPGSVLDVSGRAATLDIETDTGTDRTLVTTEVAAAAGTISLQAREGVLLGATLLGGRAPAAGAAGGTLELTLQPNLIGAAALDPFLNPFPAGPRDIVVGAGYDGTLAQGGPIAELYNGLALLDGEMLSAGGFERVVLRAVPVADSVVPGAQMVGRIRFADEATLRASREIVLAAPIIESLGDDGEVVVEAAHVALGDAAPTRASPAPAIGSNRFKVTADSIDLIGSLSLSNFATADLISRGDIRLRGARFSTVSNTMTGELIAAGDLNLTASRIYPTTLSDFLLNVPNDSISFHRLEVGSADPPWSAAGTLRVAAAHIEQDGALFAPFGSIALTATETLHLTPASLTSTAGGAVPLLFGQTEFGNDWIYPWPGRTQVVTATPDKRIGLDAPAIAFDDGATIDVSGGGDLLAFEFIPGPGGSIDLLRSDNAAGSFAIVPTFGDGPAPISPLETLGFAHQVGDVVQLDGGNGMPRGEFTILPARYALLPGAYLVTPASADGYLAPGRSIRQEDGSVLVPGRYAVGGTDIVASLWTGFLLYDGAQVRARAEYVVTTASEFFGTSSASDSAARSVPDDAGTVSVRAGDLLSLQGSLTSRETSGRGSRVDIAASALAVVDARTGSETRVELLDDDLNALGAASILLGGIREDEDGATRITAAADTIVIEPDVELRVPELVLVAGDEVRIASGAQLVAAASNERSGQGKQTGEMLRLSGQGSLARISSGAQVAIERDAAPQDAMGTLHIESGAILTASGSLTLDAARDTISDGTIDAGTSLSLSASRISLGDVPADTGGLVIDAARVASGFAGDLRLLSKSTIDFYGVVDLGAAPNTSLTSLTIDAAAVRGFGAEASVRAGEIILGNSSGGAAAAPLAPSGRLTLLADESLVFAAGAYQLEGFAEVVFDGSGSLRGTGSAMVGVGGDLTLRAAVLTADQGANLSLAAAGDVHLVGEVTAMPAAPIVAQGASLAISGESLDISGAIRLPAGVVRLEATLGDLEVREGALIDVAGHDVDFAGTVVAAPGGTIDLLAAGAMRWFGNATLDLSGAPGGAAVGDLTIDSADPIVIENDARLAGAGGGGSIRIASGAFANDTLAVLNGIVADNFTGRRQIRVRNGDLTIAAEQAIVAEEVVIAVDAGVLTLDGRIVAASPNGGVVRLSAGAAVVLTPGSLVDARATSGAGGLVEIETEGGSLTLLGAIDVSGSSTDAGGTVSLFAPQTEEAGTPGIAVADLAIDRIDAARINLVANANYVATTIDDGLRASLSSDLDTLAAGGPALLAALGAASDERVHLMPGIVISSNGNLTLASEWDLRSWRVAGEPGILTLRAAGNLTISSILSDGVGRQNDSLGLGLSRDVVLTGPSWSYRLVAGADLTASDRRAVFGGAGSLVIGPNGRVRTGTGRIDLASGGDLLFQGGTAALYTVGESRGIAGFGYGTRRDRTISQVFVGGDYVWHGGDITAAVDGAIRGFDSGQFISQWLPRVGGPVGLIDGTVTTAWAIDSGAFNQNIGALGGGDIRIRAGGSIKDLSVMLPNTARPVSGSAFPEITESGSAEIIAAGDIFGGIYFTASGTGRLSSRGEVGEGANGAAPILAVDSGSWEVAARGDLLLEAVINPTVLPISADQGYATEYGTLPPSAYFFTYSPNSAVALTSLAGDIVLRNDVSTASPIGALLDNLFTESSTIDLLRVYPASLAAQSLQGSILVQGSLSLYPSPVGDLRLLAQQDVVADTEFLTITINVSDADPALLPSVLKIADAETVRIETVQRFNPDRADLSHAAAPIHVADDTSARVVARDGTVGSRTLPLTLAIAKQSFIYAGEDISNANLQIQHAAPAHVSTVQAGAAIRFPTSRAPTTGAFTASSARIEIAGPGRLELNAGADIDLGTSIGVLSVGDLYNPVLPDQGADLALGAGLATPPDYLSFAQSYLFESDRYHDAFAAYLAEHGLEQTTTDIAARFASLPAAWQREFLDRTLFLELQQSGIAAATGTTDYQPGFAAIATLFPAPASGDINLLLSLISTLDGGDIELFAPSGDINAGVTATGLISKGASSLGIVAQRDGDIRAVLDGDFLVNQSRVFALDGGDILIWSSRGDIDAGRGAKTAIASPPPTVTFDAQGNAVVEFPAAIAGSGIRGSVATPGRAPGNVYLFAPAGFVSAGDAGIGSAGNITIGAVEVIGADNIDIGGVAVGVPQADLGGIGAGLTGVGDIAGAATEQATAQAAERAQAAAADAAAGLGGSAFAMITVEVIGFGE